MGTVSRRARRPGLPDAARKLTRQKAQTTPPTPAAGRGRVRVPVPIGTPERVQEYNAKAWEKERTRAMETAAKHGVRGGRVTDLRQILEAEAAENTVMTGIADADTKVGFRVGLKISK